MRIGGSPTHVQGTGDGGGGHDALTLGRRAGITAGHTIDEPAGLPVKRPAPDRETGASSSQETGKTEDDPRLPAPESPQAAFELDGLTLERSYR